MDKQACIPEPSISLMSLNRNTVISIKVFDSKTNTYRKHEVCLLRFINESHSAFRFVYKNKWRKDPKKTLNNSLVACKYIEDTVKNTEITEWTPPCWAIQAEDVDLGSLRIEFMSCLSDYHRRFQKDSEERKRLYQKVMNLPQAKQIKFAL